ncbi:hypothetical protein [Rhizobium rhizogenes]|uniref:hypothetical protein n=1 Tax=Rhizobium rhizogenes TaxID=359 RepID=UPI001572817C|nr:hypothetical protein [Rhizobium rhizogenes]NTF43053.1 hypothetical protein [Rhizobium rhizogenes]
MDGESKTNAVRRPAKLAAIFLLIWILLGLVSVFSRLFGYGYLPSTSFLNGTASLRITLGLIGAVLVTISSIKNIDIENGELRKILAVLTSPFLGYFLGNTPVTIGGPMLVAAIVGHHVELTYQVSNADGPGHKGCRLAIDIQDMPFGFSSLCGVPDDLREGLKPGTQIVVEGRGTSLGVYATAFHRVGS